MDAGLEMLEQGGPEGLKARALSAAAGASTMAVYTHFGGMAGLYEALTLEAFVRFDRRLAQAPVTDDPVADIFTLGLAYRDYALAHPQRYRLMFGATAPGAGTPVGHDLTAEGTPALRPEVNAPFDRLSERVRRAMAAGRMRRGDPVAAAGQVWSMVHGYVLLEITGWFGYEGRGVFDVLAPHAVNLVVGLGDDRAATESSLVAAAPDPAGLRTPPRPVPPARASPGRRRRNR